MVFSAEFGTLRTDQRNQFADRDFKAVLAVDADLALIAFDKQHAFPVRADAQSTERHKRPVVASCCVRRSIWPTAPLIANCAMPVPKDQPKAAG
jgi:hypothetical protein